MLCVNKCPDSSDLNSTTIDDYLVTTLDHNAAPTKYVVQHATTAVLNRCLPTDGGDNLQIGNDLVVLADLLSGWKLILMSGSIALIVGFTWLMLITRCSKEVVRCSILGTFAMSLLIAAGLFLIAYPDTRSTAISHC